MLGKAVSARDGLAMKVPCRLLVLFAEERYINVLKEKLSIFCKNSLKIVESKVYYTLFCHFSSHPPDT